MAPTVEEMEALDAENDRLRAELQKSKSEHNREISAHQLTNDKYDTCKAELKMVKDQLQKARAEIIALQKALSSARASGSVSNSTPNAPPIDEEVSSGGPPAAPDIDAPDAPAAPPLDEVPNAPPPDAPEAPPIAPDVDEPASAEGGRTDLLAAIKKGKQLKKVTGGETPAPPPPKKDAQAELMAAIRNATKDRKLKSAQERKLPEKEVAAPAKREGGPQGGADLLGAIRGQPAGKKRELCPVLQKGQKECPLTSDAAHMKKYDHDLPPWMRE
jgi:hypothetical protein